MYPNRRAITSRAARVAQSNAKMRQTAIDRQARCRCQSTTESDSRASCRWCFFATKSPMPPVRSSPDSPSSIVDRHWSAKNARAKSAGFVHQGESRHAAPCAILDPCFDMRWPLAHQNRRRTIGASGTDGEKANVTATAFDQNHPAARSRGVPRLVHGAGRNFDGCKAAMRAIGHRQVLVGRLLPAKVGQLGFAEQAVGRC